MIFHATLVDQRWPKCSQPSSVPNAAVTLPGSALEVFGCGLCTAATARCGSQVLGDLLPLAPVDAFALMGRGEDGSLAKHRAKESGGGKKTTTTAYAVAMPKADGEWEPQPGWSRNDLAGDGSVANHGNLRAAGPRRTCVCTGCVAPHTRSVAVLFSRDNN